MIIHDLIAVFFDKIISLSTLYVLPHHLADELLESDLGRPAELFPRFGWVAQKSFDFSRSEITWIDSDDNARLVSVNLCDHSNLIEACAFPADTYAKLFRSGIDEIAHTVLNACCDDEILGLVLLEHQPLHLDIIARVAPVA